MEKSLPGGFRGGSMIDAMNSMQLISDFAIFLNAEKFTQEATERELA